jgi:hypothetical protein
MNYTRYSRKELEALAPGSAALMQRLAELAMDVKLDLHAAVAAQFKEVVTAPNAVGHELRETPASRPGELDYAQGNRPHPFFLGCDITISSGYLGTSACDASIEDQTRWEKDWARSQQGPDKAPEPTSGMVTTRGEPRDATIPPVA